MKQKNFTKQQNKILSEIYRRLNYFHSGNLNESLLYLGYPSDAKIISVFELIKPYRKEIPRVLNWYNLTEKGKKFFANYVTKHRLSSKRNSALFSGEYIKNFNKSLLSDKP